MGNRVVLTYNQHQGPSPADFWGYAYFVNKVRPVVDAGARRAPKALKSPGRVQSH
jgi:hypothetical protein